MYTHTDMFQMMGPSYSFYVWPSAPVLAQYVWVNRHRLKNKQVLEASAHWRNLEGLIGQKYILRKRHLLIVELKVADGLRHLSADIQVGIPLLDKTAECMREQKMKEMLTAFFPDEDVRLDNVEHSLFRNHIPSFTNREIIFITEKEIQDLCSNPNVRKAPGPDNLQQSVQISGGTCLPGLVAARCGAKMIFSDLPSCLPHIQDNMAANWLSDTSHKTMALLWGTFTPDLFSLPPLDILIASDCFYEPAGTIWIILLRVRPPNVYKIHVSSKIQYQPARAARSPEVFRREKNKPQRRVEAWPNILPNVFGWPAGKSCREEQREPKWVNHEGKKRIVAKNR
ncbi:METTL23 [Cordylochernes scorpioides]|uniref:METTL23 n=1 Tax=Cordylochernes scorpioides TaxID=51811 RepID=A0ABY6KBJ5_9ARAC|nr:METTL23 [Cordylochernes scorpioides]